MISEMRFAEVVELLGEIFPCARSEDTPLQALTEPGSQMRSASYGYERIHKDIIDPLDEIGRTLHGISLAITHAYGAFG